MKLAFCLFVISFLVATFLVAPFLHYRDNVVIPMNTKQGLRTFLESVNPEILQRIDKGGTEILTILSASSHVKLVNLSEQPDFNNYLSFKHIGDEENDFNDFEDPNVFVEGDKMHIWTQAYYFYPKDALVK